MLDYIHNTTLYSDPYLKGSYEWWANLNKSIDYNKKKNTDTSDPEKEKLKLIEEAKEAYKTQLTSSVVNLVGNVADLGTSEVSSDMVFNEGTLKFSQISRILDNTPFGPAAKLGRFGLNSIAKGISTEINNFDFDPNVEARMGSAYDFKKFNDLKKTNNKSALFWETGNYNREKFNASQQYNKIASIDSDQQSRLAMYNNVNQNLLNYNAKINGGINIPSFGKKGLKFDLVKRAKKIKSKINLNTKQIEEFEHGGFIPEITEFRPVIINDYNYILKKLQKGGKTTRSLKELITYAKEQNPRFVQRLSESPRGIKFIDNEGNESNGSHYLEWSTDETGNAIIYPRIQEMEDGSLKFLSTEDAYKRAMDNKNVLKMSQEEAEIFFAEDPEYRTAYKRGWPEFFKIFKQGGNIKESELVKLKETNLKNVIPEGALHKNKHHMEHADGLTLKGIPVIDNNGDLQAEIELNEIIFTLEVTKKLEKLHKIFKEGSNKEKDEAAIEAGKLLVQEILYNTDDRTGLISKCLKGGKI